MKDDNFLRENVGRHMWHPMGHPGETRDNPAKIVTAASGVRITDIDGHETIDAVGGLWNVNLGYSCAPVKAAIAAQLDALPYYSAFKGTTNDAAIELSWMLRETLEPEGLTRAFFTSGGSDSVEIALRLARQYHRIRGEGARTKYLSLKRGYHGTHTGGASVNGNPLYRAQYEPLIPGCHNVPAPYPYRNPWDETDPERLAALCLRALEEEIVFQSPETVAAFIMEPVMGAGGVIPPHASFMPGVREICSRHGVLLIADEVITGFGRTGDWTGSRHWGVRPDMATFAKAITTGYFPFGATMLSEAVAATFEDDATGRAMIGSGYTYSGHPVGAAAAIACLTETRRLDVAANAAARGAELFAGLRELAGRHAIVGDVRGGHGLMCALELVTDRDTKEPAPLATVMRAHEATYRAGVMVRPSGANLIMSPPLIVTAQDVAAILGALDEGLAAV